MGLSFMTMYFIVGIGSIGIYELLIKKNPIEVALPRMGFAGICFIVAVYYINR